LQGMRVLKSGRDPIFLLASTLIFEVSEYILLLLQLSHQIAVCL
jgi:hypothetical protein